MSSRCIDQRTTNRRRPWLISALVGSGLLLLAATAGAGIPQIVYFTLEDVGEIWARQFPDATRDAYFSFVGTAAQPVQVFASTEWDGASPLPTSSQRLTVLFRNAGAEATASYEVISDQCQRMAALVQSDPATYDLVVVAEMVDAGQISGSTAISVLLSAQGGVSCRLKRVGG